MSTGDLIEWRPESASAPNAPPADTRPGPSFADTIAASFTYSRADTAGYAIQAQADAYSPIMMALGELGYNANRYVGYNTGQVDPDTVWEDVLKAKAKGYFKDLPATAAEFEKTWRARERARLDEAGTTAASGNGLASLLGGVAAGLTDPINLLTMPVGGFGRTVATKVLTEGLVQAGIEAASLPVIQGQRRELGREAMTGGEMLADVGLAFLGGATFKGAHLAAPKIDALGYRAAAPIRAKIDPLFREQDLARAFGKAVPEHLMNPEQAAAYHVLTREEALDRASPYVDTHAAGDAHRERLTEAWDAIQSGRIAVERPQRASATFTPGLTLSRSASRGSGPSGQLHGGIVAFFRENGLSEAQARGIAAGIFAESGNSHGVVNPSSGAFGLGQWLGPRKRELIRRYGANPSMRQQLEFLLWELRGGDHGGAKVLAQGDEASVLRAYVQDFMRPAKGAETTGDLQRGMGALGRGEEDLPVLEGGAPAGDDLAATLAGLDAEEAAIGDGARDVDPFPEPLEPAGPQLKRSGFGSDTEWRIAQADAEAKASGADPADDLLYRLRKTVLDREGRRSLNQSDALAAELGTTPGALREGLDRLAELGEIKRDAKGRYARLPVAATRGEDDLLRFVARNGGLSYDGLSTLGREKGTSLGHDLRNSGNLDHFVPGAGPLLRPNGKGLDEMGELLHEQGFFGPPETTPRPTEREVIDTLDELIRTGNKRFAGGGEVETGAPAQRGVRRKGGLFQSDEHYDARRAEYNEAARSVLGRDLEEDEFLDAFADDPALPRDDRLTSDEHLQQRIVDMANRRLDTVLDDAWFEAEKDVYDLAAWDLEHAARGEGEAGRDGGAGSGAVEGDAREGGLGGEAGPRDPGQAQLSESAADAADELGLRGDPPTDTVTAKAFDDDAGEGVRAAADSDWHDIRAGVEWGKTVELPEGDSRGQGVQYHGARGELPDLTEGYYNPDNIYGGFDTFYTTDATDIAGGYQRKRPNGKIYRAEEVEPVETFDMEKALPVEDIWALFSSKSWADADGFPASAIEEATRNDGTLNLREAMDEIRDSSRGEDVSKDEVQEIFDTAIANLQDRGFGAMRHVGGLKTSKAPHNVKIYFNAKDQLRLTEATKAERSALDGGEAVDPNDAERARQENELRAAAPLSGRVKGGEEARGTAQDPAMPAGLFGGEAEPRFDLEDGKGLRTAAEIEAEIAADRSALDAIRNCLT